MTIGGGLKDAKMMIQTTYLIGQILINSKLAKFFSDHFCQVKRIKTRPGSSLDSVAFFYRLVLRDLTSK